MRITFVGSSHGVPEPNRRCSCIMIETGGRVYFVDMGTSAVDALRTRGIPVEAVQAVFITHMHGDHTNGLIPFIDLITWYFKQVDPLICLPMAEAADVIERWLKATLNEQPHRTRYRQTEEGLVYDDGVLRVTAAATKHCLRSFAYLVEAEGKRVLFTGDLRGAQVDFPEAALAQSVDLVVCEAAHFKATDYLPVFERGDIAKVCVTHYNEEFFESVLQMQKALNARGVEAVRATDGLTLDV